MAYHPFFSAYGMVSGNNRVCMGRGFLGESLLTWLGRKAFKYLKLLKHQMKQELAFKLNQGKQFSF